MKKTTSRKTLNTKKNATLRVAPVVANNDCKKCFNPWSLSIYVYWFIILFFIAATFYILGRSHGTLTSPVNNVEITEEALMQSNDYYESGKTKLLAGNIDEAIAELNNAIEVGTTNVDAYILRGEAYMQSGNYDAAMNDFNTALEMDSENSVAFYDRALLNTRLESYDAALNDINDALAARAAHPNDILQLRDLYAKRGQLNLWLKNWDGAIADYTNSLSLPDGVVNPDVYAERAEAFTATGDYASAINDYSSAVRVISEQIQGATTAEERESLSSHAMDYFEKSAALNVNLGNTDAAVSDLNSARTIAVALNDNETIAHLDSLIAELQNPGATQVYDLQPAEQETSEQPVEM